MPLALAVMAVPVALAGNLHLSVDTLSDAVISFCVASRLGQYHQSQQADKHFVLKVSATFGLFWGGSACKAFPVPHNGYSGDAAND